MKSQAKMVEAFLDALGIDKVDLVGNDSGGGIAQIFAARNPDRTRSITLTNCEVHEYDVMRRYCRTHEDPAVRAELVDAIRSRGAFRRFKDAIQRHGLGDEWYAYKDRALEAIAVDWLDENQIAFSRD